MAIVFDSDAGTITGLSVGGLPDGVVDSGTIATGTIVDADVANVAASKLTGALPAISGASLTSLPVQKINPNILINGGFDVAQRGTTISGIGSAKYTLDRWTAISSGADSTVTQVSGATYPKALRLTGAGSTSGTYLQQKVESINSRHLAGQTATFSVYLRASTSINIEFSIKYATSTDNFGGTTSIASTTFNVTTTDTKFTWTGSIPNAATTGIQVQLKIGSQGSAWYEASNAKLELGSTATDFEYRSYGEELALCQRYYYAMPAPFGAYYSAYGTRWFTEYSTYPVVMRANPSVSYKSGSVRYSYYQYGWQSDNLSALATKLGDQRGISLCITATGSYSPSNHGMYTAESNSYVANIDAEL